MDSTTIFLLLAVLIAVGCAVWLWREEVRARAECDDLIKQLNAYADTAESDRKARRCAEESADRMGRRHAADREALRNATNTINDIHATITRWSHNVPGDT
ncbi:MAG: hypothetical protein ACOY3P_14355 [Planctomycetota bacterium]